MNINKYYICCNRKVKSAASLVLYTQACRIENAVMKHPSSLHFSFSYTKLLLLSYKNKKNKKKKKKERESSVQTSIRHKSSIDLSERNDVHSHKNLYCTYDNRIFFKPCISLLYVALGHEQKKKCRNYD